MTAEFEPCAHVCAECGGCDTCCPGNHPRDDLHQDEDWRDGLPPYGTHGRPPRWSFDEPAGGRRQAATPAATDSKPPVTNNSAAGAVANDNLPPLPGEEPSPQPAFDPDEHGTATRGKGQEQRSRWRQAASQHARDKRTQRARRPPPQITGVRWAGE